MQSNITLLIENNDTKENKKIEEKESSCENISNINNINNINDINKVNNINENINEKKLDIQNKDEKDIKTDLDESKKEKVKKEEEEKENEKNKVETSIKEFSPNQNINTNNEQKENLIISQNINSSNNNNNNSKTKNNNSSTYLKKKKYRNMSIEMFFKPKSAAGGEKILLNNEQLKLIINKATSEKFLKNLNSEIIISKLIYEIKLKSNKKYHIENINEFYEKSKSLKNTIILIKTIDNIMFGGFSKNGFILDCKDSDSFVFSIDKMKTYGVVDKNISCVICQKGKLPEFKHQIIFKKNSVYYGFTGIKGKGYLVDKDYELNSGNEQFYVECIQLITLIDSK